MRKSLSHFSINRKQEVSEFSNQCPSNPIPDSYSPGNQRQPLRLRENAQIASILRLVFGSDKCKGLSKRKRQFCGLKCCCGDFKRHKNADRFGRNLQASGSLRSFRTSRDRRLPFNPSTLNTSRCVIHFFRREEKRADFHQNARLKTKDSTSPTSAKQYTLARKDGQGAPKQAVERYRSWDVEASCLATPNREDSVLYM